MKKYFYFFLIILCASELFADIKLASLFTDNMVIQRNKPVNVWGTADPGEKITIAFNSQSGNTTADEKGNWKIKLPVMKEGGPYEFKAEGKNTITLNNVMIGEVWICSGQSNMEFTLKKSAGGDEEISKADFPLMRIYIVKHKVADTPQSFCEGKWELCSPKTIGKFSGAGYFFGKNLLKELNVPIGIIQSTWGGTPAEAWMAKEVLQSDNDFKPIITRWGKKMEEYPSALEEFKRSGKDLIAAWIKDSINAVSKGMAPPRKPGSPEGPGTRNQPTGLYNGMIYPLVPFSFQGVIWYQGEANASRGYQYRKLFPALIRSWREVWNIVDIQFYFVQLPNLLREPEPSKSGWAELREAQLMTLSLANTGMAVTIDVGDSTNLHPTNKLEVGNRLSLIALNKVYSRNEVDFSGPIYNSYKKDGNKFIIKFNHTAMRLMTKDEKALTGFTISADDKKFVNAKAEINGDMVIVWSDKVENPASVRYGWADNPNCNLINSAKLPASPFRTDEWPEVTFGKN